MYSNSICGILSIEGDIGNVQEALDLAKHIAMEEHEDYSIDDIIAEAKKMFPQCKFEYEGVGYTEIFL
jgi:hypothetical protein